MTEKEKDILIDEITNVADQSCNDGFNYYTAEKLATELVERLVKKLNKDDVSNRRELLLSFLNDTQKELGHSKVNMLNAENTVDSYIKRKL